MNTSIRGSDPAPPSGPEVKAREISKTAPSCGQEQVLENTCFGLLAGRPAKRLHMNLYLQHEGPLWTSRSHLCELASSA